MEKWLHPEIMDFRLNLVYMPLKKRGSASNLFISSEYYNHIEDNQVSNEDNQFSDNDFEKLADFIKNLT